MLPSPSRTTSSLMTLFLGNGFYHGANYRLHFDWVRLVVHHFVHSRAFAKTKLLIDRFLFFGQLFQYVMNHFEVFRLLLLISGIGLGYNRRDCLGLLGLI